MIMRFVTLFSLLSAMTIYCNTDVNMLLLRFMHPLQFHIVLVQQTQVGDFGELRVNGQPVVIASLNKFAGWVGLGWLQSQDDYEQRLREAKDAGFNTLWVREPPPNFWSTWSMWVTANAYDLQGNREVFNPDRIAQIACDPALLLCFFIVSFTVSKAITPSGSKTETASRLSTQIT